MRATCLEKKLLLAAFLGMLAFGFNSQVIADVSFEGETIEVLIGSSPGGGTDTTVRLKGEFLVKYLPGEPRVVFRNRPGASGTTAMNYFVREVVPDGTTIAGGTASLAAPTLWRRQQSHYNPTEFHYIGGAQRGSTSLIINKDALERLTDHSQPPVIMGALDGSRVGMQMMLWGVEFLDWNVRWVIGYPGTSDIMLALQRGEVDVTSTSNSVQINELMSTGDFELLVQSGIPTDDGLIPRSEFPDVPIFSHIIRPELTTERHKSAFEYWEGVNTLDKSIALPPGTPEEIVNVYREAWSKVVQDPTFLERGRVVISEDFNPLPGAEQARLVRQVAFIDDDSLRFIQEMRERQGLPVNR